MKIKHTITRGDAELELTVYVLVTAWDRDDRDHVVIEDLEFEQIEYFDDNGEECIAEGEIESEILEILENDDDFIAKIYAETEEEREEYLVERDIQRRESAIDAEFERRRGN